MEDNYHTGSWWQPFLPGQKFSEAIEINSFIEINPEE